MKRVREESEKEGVNGWHDILNEDVRAVTRDLCDVVSRFALCLTCSYEYKYCHFDRYEPRWRTWFMDTRHRFLAVSVRFGFLDYVIMFYRRTDNDPSLLDDATKKGYFHIMKWLRAHGSPFHPTLTFKYAAQHGNLEHMKWLREQECPWDPGTFIEAARQGNLENMKWLLTAGCPWSSYTFAMAAKYGNLDNMRWLRDNNCPWDVDTAFEAAEAGILENLKWLKEQNCPWPKGILARAASGPGPAHLACVQWLRENGAHWHTSVFENAADHGNLPLMQWLFEQGCPTTSVDLFPNAARFGDLESMKWLYHEAGVPFTDFVFCHAIDAGRLENLQWLRQEKCPWGYTKGTTKSSIKDPAILAWLLQEGYPFPEVVKQTKKKKKKPQNKEKVGKV